MGYIFSRKANIHSFYKRDQFKFMSKREIREIEDLFDNPFEIASKSPKYCPYEPISDDERDVVKNSIYEPISDEEPEVVYCSSDFTDNSKVKMSLKLELELLV